MGLFHFGIFGCQELQLIPNFIFICLFRFYFGLENINLWLVITAAFNQSALNVYRLFKLLILLVKLKNMFLLRFANIQLFHESVVNVYEFSLKKH
jgi:hypothetical protein